MAWSIKTDHITNFSFKVCIPKILLPPLLNTLTHWYLQQSGSGIFAVHFHAFSKCYCLYLPGKLTHLDSSLTQIDDLLPEIAQQQQQMHFQTVLSIHRMQLPVPMGNYEKHNAGGDFRIQNVKDRLAKIANKF